MFGKKKTKIEQPITPEELSRLNDKKMADAEIEHFHVKNDSIEIVKYKKRRRLLSIILSVCIIILLILFIVSTLVTQWGDLIISIDSPAVKKGIVLSEDPDFKTQSASLTAEQVKDVTNITYAWLPVDLTQARTVRTTVKTMLLIHSIVKITERLSLTMMLCLKSQVRRSRQMKQPEL